MQTITYGDRDTLIVEKTAAMGFTTTPIKIITLRMKKRWKLWFALKRLMQFKRPTNQWKPTKDTE